MSTKKFLLVIAFVVVTVGFGVLIYFVFIRDLVEPANTNENVNAVTNVNGALPNINGVDNTNQAIVTNINGEITITQPTNVNIEGPSDIALGGDTTAKPIVTTSVQAAEPVKSGAGIRFYDETRDKFYRVDDFGSSIELSEQTFPQATDIAWSPTEDKAIITFPDASKILYDFDSDSQITIPKDWDDIEFSPTGTKVAFKNLSENEGDRWLAIANPDGSEIQLVESLGDKAKDVDVNWSPNGQVVALFRESTTGTAQEVYPIGIYNENFKSVTTNGRGFEGTWSSDGSQLLYSVFSADTNYNPMLYLVDASGDYTGGNNMKLSLKTWSYKCTFSENAQAAYCAVPKLLKTGSGLAPEVTENTNDIIYKIDTNTGSKSILAIPDFEGSDEDYNISSVFLSNDEQYLYLINSYTGNVHSIQLR